MNDSKAMTLWPETASAQHVWNMDKLIMEEGGTDTPIDLDTLGREELVPK